MHFWGDIIIKHPELIRELPRDAVVLEWGYDAGHPFASRCPRYAATGLPFYVCPGTSSWNSLAGRTDNCLANLRQAAESGLRNGAVGYLNTDWGDNGHWQCLPVSYLGFAAGAACCWALEANDGADLRRALDVHAFRDEAGVVGATAWDLGNAYRHCGQETPNSSVLWRFLQNDRFAASPKVTPRKLAGALEWVEAAAARLGRARMRRGDAALVLDEFRNNARMLAAGCRRGIVQLRGGRAAAAEGRRLAGELRQILGEHRRLWLARNREGGLQDSARVLEERVRECEETWK
jgi:hypothetical protein